MKDLVGFYQNRDTAERVKNDLLAAGFDRDDITIYDHTGKDEASVWEEIKNAFGHTDADDQRLYAEATRRGAVAAGLSFDHDDVPERALQIMQKYQPIDLEGQAARGRQQPQTQRAGQAQGSQVVPVVEEQLKVGKRAVGSAGIRIHNRVTEKPVAEQVRLREEQVRVERRPVDRPLSDADKAFRGESISVPVTREEAVVIKKDVQERSETVRDKVRRSDVEVERTGTQGDGQIAEKFAQECAMNQSYRGRDWKAIEPEVRQNFEKRYPGSRWEQFKDAISRQYESARQRV